MTFKCWYKTNPSLDSKCDQKEDKCFKEKLCSHEQKCISIGVNDENNITSLVFSDCFSTSDNCTKKDKCVSYTSKLTSNGNYFCCCENSLCNRNFTLVNDGLPLKPINNNKNIEINSEMNIVLIVGLVLAILVLTFLLLTMIIYLICKKRRKKLGRYGTREEAPITVVCPDIKQESKALIELYPKLSIQSVNLIDKISQSHLSTVWYGKFNDLDVAVKIYTQNEKQSWQNEKEIYSNIEFSSYEFILKFIIADVIIQNNVKEYWLLTEYQSNGCLYNYLKSNLLSWDQICNFSLSILNGLAYLHSEIQSIKSSIAHRDIKSKNILIKTNGTCCIADFGLANILKNGKLDDADIRSQVGTRRYMAPELLEGAITFTKETLMRIDVYSCALVLWELLSRGNFYSKLNL